MTARTCWPQLWLSRSAITRRTASGVLPAAESEMIVTDLLGYCWTCACTWVAADSGSSQKHAIISECEHNLTFMSPARRSIREKRPRVSARARCLSLWPKRLPAEAEESALTSIPRRPPTIRQSGYLGKEHNDAASVASESHEAFIDNDSSIDIVGERRADRREGRLARGGSIENRDQNHRIDPSTGAASICRRSYWPMSPTGTSIPSGHPFAGLYLPKARAAQSPDFKRSMRDHVVAAARHHGDHEEELGLRLPG